VVTWSLIGNHAPGTVINALGNNTAELVMAADEPNNEFTVRAVSVADNEKYGEAVVKQGYTVSFNSMGGSPVSSLSRITYGGEAVRPIDPTRAGYNFGGWYREDTFGTPWNFTDDKVLGNTTLYAKWTEIVTLTVTFEANGGIPAPSTQTVVHGGTVTAPPEMTKAGHTFGGWYREDTFGTSWSFSNTVTADTTLYAQWIPVYTVSFDSMGGSPVNSQTGISSGGKAAEPSIPTRTGYSFAGWYQNSEYTGLQWVFDKNDVTANITLYARWNVNSYTVTFNANGAASGNPPPSITADYGAAIPLPGKGTMIGPESTTPGTPKNFMGWTTTPDSSVVMYEAGGGYTIPDQNVVLYACWANPGVNVIIVPPGSILPDPFTLNKNDSTARKTIVIPGTYELIWWQVDSGAQTGPDSDKPNEFMVDSRKYTSTPLECPHQLMVRIRNVDTGEERTDSVSFWVVAN
jgi:uncharacterized repeat protein (TIGR02543 family)